MVLPTCYISVERVFNAADDGILVVYKPVAAHSENHNSDRSDEQGIGCLVACESRGAECAAIYLTGVGDVVILAVPVVRAFERAPRCPVRCTAYRSAVNGNSDIYLADVRAVFLEVAQSLFGLLKGTLISVLVVSVIRHELNLVETVKSLI